MRGNLFSGNKKWNSPPLNLEAYFVEKSNSLNLARLLLALLVLVSHVGWFYGKDNTQIRGLGVYAVSVFFGISGFLIFQSASSAKGFFQFATRRVRRIYPAFVAVLITTALIYYPVYVIIQSGSVSGINLIEQARYVAENISLHVIKDSITNSLSVSGTMNWNPSLWTLEYELLFYFVTFFVSRNLKFKPELVLPTLVMLLVLLTNITAHQSNMYYLFYLAQFYFFGMTLWTYRSKIKISLTRTVLIIVSVILSYTFIRQFTLTAFLMILLALSISIQIQAKFFTVNDFSYGVYLHAGPVTHIAVLLVKKLDWPFLMAYAIALTLTFLLAILSWFWVENRFNNKGRPL